MRPFTTTILFFLTAKPFTQGQIIPNIPATPHQPPISVPQPHRGCRPPMSQGNYIYFTSPTDLNFTFFIATPWKNTYPNVLRTALTRKGFSLTGAPYHSFEALRTEMCDWTIAERVIVKGVHHGDIGYKYTEAHHSEGLEEPSKAANNITAQRIQNQSSNNEPTTNKTTTHKPHLISRLPPPPAPAPLNTTISTIRTILLTHSPSRDFAIFILQIMLPMIFIALLILAVEWHLNRRAARLVALEELNLELEEGARTAYITSSASTLVDNGRRDGKGKNEEENQGDGEENEQCLGLSTRFHRFKGAKRSRVVDVRRACEDQERFGSQVGSDPVGETFVLSVRR